MPRLGTGLSVVVAFLVVVVAMPARTRAQFRRATTPVTAPPVSFAAPEDLVSLDVNPGALGFLPAWGLRYTHVEASEGSSVLGAGDAFYVGGPLLLGLSLALDVESIRPTVPFEADRAMVALGIGYAVTDALGLGVAVRWFDSNQDSIDGLSVFDLGLSFRPSRVLAFSLVGRDLNGPARLAGVDVAVPASVMFGTAIRPTGTRAITFDLGAAVDTDGRVGGRAMVEVGVPYVGRLHAVAEWNDIDGGSEEELRALFGLAIDWGGLGAGGGALFGEGLDGKPAWYGTVRLEGIAREGLPTGRHVADIEVGGIGARGIIDLVLRLDSALRDERVAGVLLRFRESEIGLAYAQEIRWMVERLAEAGKPVICHLDDGSGSELYACAAGAGTFLDPAGGIRLTGPEITTLLLGDLLDQVGVRADFVRIGRFKSAPEQYMNSESSSYAVRQRAEFLDDVYRRLVRDLAGDYHRDPYAIKTLIDEGPYVTEEALAVNLAMAEADETELDERVASVLGRSYPRMESAPPRLPPSWGQPRRIGVVVVDDQITDGRNTDIPFIGIRSSGGRTISETIDAFTADPRVGVIVLRVDSPGGSVLASDQIWRAVMRARKVKPVIASMGAVAASGGYYVASAANEIWADPATLTGSIGVFFGKVDVAPLAEKVDIGIEQLRRGRRAGVESLYRPFTPDERAMLAGKLRIWYRNFLGRIEEGRGMKPAEVHPLAQGRIWSGDAAKRLGLIDHLGGFGAALARARGLAGYDDEVEVVIAPARPEGLLDYVLGTGASASLTGGDDQGVREGPPMLSPLIREAAGFVVGMANTRPGVPMAILPAVVHVE